jgi:putative chitinase
MVFANILFNLWPSGDKLVPGLRAGMVASAPTLFVKYGVTNTTILAQFMAQISLECGAGTEVVENLNYTAVRMTQVWPSRFPSVNSAVPYAHNPRLLANKVYNGRMGNKPNSNDGYNNRGRGATQTTGAEGYAALQAFLAKRGVDLDLLNNPDLINDPRYFLECGLADFTICGCMPWAAKDDIVEVTIKLNGGETDLAERRKWLVKWKGALKGLTLPLPIEGTSATNQPTVVPVPAMLQADENHSNWFDSFI